MTLRKSTKLIVVHVTATQPKTDIGVAEVRVMHKALGWKDVGYHYIIRRNGVVEAGRPEGDVGSHVAGFNSIALGISMVGGINASGKPENNATPEQWAALVNLLGKMTAKYPEAKVCGHRDLSPDKDGDGIIEPSEHMKACPCFDAIPWAAAQGLPEATIKGVWDKDKIVIPAAVNSNGKIESVAGPDARNVYLQKLLERAGYRFGAIDGLIGAKTRKAIKAYQLFAGLHQTGEFDAATVNYLRVAFEPAKAA